MTFPNMHFYCGEKSIQPALLHEKNAVADKKTAFLYNYFFVDRGMFFVAITQIIS